MELAEWISKARAVTYLGIPEVVFDDLVNAALLPKGSRIGHRTVKWKRVEIEAAGVLMGLLTAALERLSSPDHERHDAD